MSSRSLTTVVATLSAAFALAGCVTTSASQPILQSGGQAFGNGTTAASKVLSTEISAAPDVDRQFLIFGQLPPAYQSDASHDTGFEGFACAGLDLGANASASLAAATQVASTVGDLTASSSSDLGTVLASIAKYRDAVPPTVNLPKPPQMNREAECKASIASSLTLLRPAARPRLVLAAIPAAVTALSALYDSVKTLITLIAQTDDASIREKLLIQFLNNPGAPAVAGVGGNPGTPATPGTDDVMVAALGPCAHYSAASVKADGTLNAPSACNGPLASGGEIDTLFNRRVASTLVTPFVQYVDTQIDTQKVTQAGKPLLSAHEIVERLETVQANLAAFDAIRTQSPPGDLAMPIAKAYLNLRRLADGKLTTDEKNKSFSDQLSEFYSLMNGLYKDVTDLQTKAQAAQQAVQKL